jgi:2',3'-cyclic-nucleotide 2'-phosphodiesterase (5'-nucleotidase family)/subtilisin family serine protease
MRNRFLTLLLVAALVSGVLLVFLSTSSQAAMTPESLAAQTASEMPWVERTLPAHLQEVPAEVQELFAEGMSVNEFVQMAGYVPRALEGLVDGEALMIIEFAEVPMAVYYADQKAAGVEMTTEALENYQKVLADAQTAVSPQIENLGATIISNYTAAYNGMQVYTPLSALNDLRALPGVKAIHPAPIHDINLGGSVDLIGAPDVWNDFGYDGDGMVIAIIDTGIDYTHAVFGGSGDPDDYANNDPDIIEPGTFPTAKVIGGYDFAGTTYNANPADPAYQPIPNPDRDPLDENRHGTHVASISAGEAAGDVANGVAPGAQLMALKVFGRSGSTALTIDALDFATYSYLMFGYPQVINMSLGSNFGTDDPANPSVAGSNNAAAAGIVVVASAGNASNFSYITGAPGSASKAISVASSTTGFATGPTVNISGTAFITQTDIIYSVASFANNTGHYENEVVAPLGYVGALSGAANNLLCDTTGIAANALAGQIALIQRGACAFTIKVNNAATLGAVGAIIYNNAAGAFGMTGDPVTIPAGSIQMQDGMNLIPANGQTVVVSAEDDVSTVPDPYTPADFISGFSSRGPRGYDSAMKPEITAPGSGIFAANMASGGGGVSLSGTSMAAPHVAGVAALVLQGNPTMTPEQVKAAMMNTTVPLADNTVIPRSGSGRVDAYRAVETETIAIGDEDLVSLSFGVIMSRNDTVDRVKEVTVYNWGATPMTYDVAVAFQAGSNTAGATVSVSPMQVTVPAGGSATVDVTLSLDMTMIPAVFSATAVEEYYGFVTFTPPATENDPELVLPFYAQARPYSQLEEIVATGSISNPDTDYITYEITHLGPISSSLWAYPALVWNDTPDPNMYGFGDVRLFGMDFAGSDPTFGDIIAVGIDAWDYWHTPQPLFAEFDLYVDADQDGVWDYINFNWNNGARTGGANNNTWVVTQVDLATNTVFLGSPYTIYTDFNSSYMEWYLPADWQDLGPTASTFDYQLLGFDPGGVSVTPVGSFDYVNYPFGWMVSDDPGPANRDAELWVGINDLDGYFYSQPAGVMIVDYNGDPRNMNGGQAYFQPFELDFAWLQVAHLAPFAMDPGTAVTVTLNGAPALTDFAYGDSTGYIMLPADTYVVEIFPGSAMSPAIAATVTLDALNYYTAIAIGDGVNQDLELLALLDDPTPPAPGFFHLRLGHLAPFAAGNATADVRLQDGTPVLEGVNFGDVTGFLPLPAGEYDLKITTPGGAVTLIDPEPVTLTEGLILSAFATGDITNQPVGVFALPAGDPGFFLPLTVYDLYMPFIADNHNPAEWLELTLLHTNDTHARVDEYNRNGARCTEQNAIDGLCIAGTPRLATVVEEIRNTRNNVLLLDAGDQFQGTLFYNVFRGDVLTLTMNYLGYDAMAVGNHEFDNGPDTLASFISGATFPVLSANIDASNEPLLDGLILPYTVVEVAGHDIGIIGLTTPDTSNISSPGPNITFTPPITALQTAANELMGMGVDKIIALTHMGYDVDLVLAEQVSGVDVIIGGHSHSFLYYPAEPISFAPPTFPQFGPLLPVGEYPTVVESPTGDPVLVIQAYQWGTFLGELNVTFGPGGTLGASYGNPIFLGADVAKDPVLDTMLDPYRDAVADLIATEVGTTTVDLLIVDGGQQICRLGECLMGNLVADAMLWKANEVEPTANYQIAFQNGGGLRAPILAGPVTMGDVLETLPFGNAISTFELQGMYVKAALENGASRYPSANGGFAQVSGLRYEIDPSQPVGSRIVDVEVWNGTGWDPLDMDEMYKVVTNDFMRRGGDNYLMFRDFAVNPYDFGPLLDEALAEYFGLFSPVTPVIEGRITFTP